MAIEMEAEVIVYMLIGVALFTVLELVLGLKALKGREKDSKYALVGHAVSTLVAFYFLFLVVFEERMSALGIPEFRFDLLDSVNHSMALGTFGVFWGISVICLIYLLQKLAKDGTTGG